MINSGVQKCPTQIEDLILQGGDERTDLDSRGLNKYFLRTPQLTGLLNRGSCTCSPISPYAYQQLTTWARELKARPFDLLRKNQEQRLKSLLNYEGQDKFEVFFAPSGSDLVYFPLLFASMLYPDRRITNLLTCPEELGSGTQIAANGKYFMHKNQFGEPIPQGEALSPKLKVNTLHYKARGRNGQILYHKNQLLSDIQRYQQDALLGSLVIGSKSGIENNLNVIMEAPPDMLWVVDLCQFRNSKRLINHLLAMNCLIMLTGSKFYQAPPFCGAMLVPQPLVKRLQDAEIRTIEPFRRLFSCYDVPAALPRLRASFPQKENYGLTSRWECALVEMEAFDRIPREESNAVIEQWNRFVRDRLTEKPDVFELMPDQEHTNNSIISFRIKVKEQFLDKQALQNLFEQIVTDQYSTLGEYKKVFIGQPVSYGDRAFIRVALGAHDLRVLLEGGSDFEHDRKLIDIIYQKALQFAV